MGDVLHDRNMDVLHDRNMDVLLDRNIAEAILDRLLKRGAHLALRARSHRTRHLNEEDTPPRRAKTA